MHKHIAVEKGPSLTPGVNRVTSAGQNVKQANAKVIPYKTSILIEGNKMCIKCYFPVKSVRMTTPPPMVLGGGGTFETVILDILMHEIPLNT